MTVDEGRSDRWRRLLDLLADHGSVSVTAAAERLGVSAATIRRDFTRLEQQQLATRTHGGVVAASVAYDLPARYRRQRPDHPKERVAAAAAQLVRPGMVVGFNGGTTTTAAARQLAARPDLADEPDTVTVVTNTLNIATELVLRPHLRTICIGGVARRESYELHGPFADRLLADIHLDLLMLGVDALTPEDGAMCRHLGEAGINAEMVAHAQQVVVVATAAKLETAALARICSAQDIGVLITDGDADAERVQALTEAGVDVRTV